MYTLTLTLTLLVCFLNTCRALECKSENKTLYFADIYTGCKVYHICEDSELKTLRCPSGQAFDRQTSKCENASAVTCYEIFKHSIVPENTDQVPFGNNQSSSANLTDLESSTEIEIQTYLHTEEESTPKLLEEREEVARKNEVPFGNNQSLSANLTDLESSTQTQIPTSLHTEEESNTKLLEEREEAVRKNETNIVEDKDIIKGNVSLDHEQKAVIERIAAKVMETIELYEKQHLEVLEKMYVFLRILEFLAVIGIIVYCKRRNRKSSISSSTTVSA